MPALLTHLEFTYLSRLTMNSFRISVALCTYNGASYLQEQLASISAQSVLPLELIVCDDCSTDATVTILQEFASHALFPVRIIQNQQRLGSTLNFDQAITLCTGDIIALADQDDVWRSDKLKRLAKCLSIPGIVAAFSDAEITNEVLEPLGYTMWKRLAFGEQEQRLLQSGHALKLLLKRHLVMGATLAFCADLRKLILPIPSNWHHDAWIALISAAYGKIEIDQDCLVKYRQHGKNQIGGRKISLVTQISKAVKLNRSAYLKEELGRWSILKQRLLEQEKIVHQKITAIISKESFLKRRINFPQPRYKRLFYVLREIHRQDYANFSRNWGSIALDLLIK
jgi:glycosyltransferase involved in cell wall biosynthesis